MVLSPILYREADTAEGPGYEKLKNFCAKAREYNVEFAWSDTCCIDKSSSTELDESIRSMFRWYKNSAICIIHLAQSKTIKDMEWDEWMERGWTLQELLAPGVIKFFNKDWMPMTGDEDDKSGEETEVMETLHRATGIPHDDLRTFQPGPVRVDERMAWAAMRQTTRVEDVAYSLMGIFDVSLQIAYGEGGDRAFYRLIEALMHAGSPSVLNWAGEAAKHHSSACAIPRSPRSFMGSKGSWFCDGRLEMTMTSLGLRVPLVILPLNFHSEEFVEISDVQITLDCPRYPTIVPRLYNRSQLRCETVTNEFALGIVNYSLISGGSQAVLGVRGKSVGVILTRYPVSRQPAWARKPRRDDLAGLKCIPGPEEQFSEWKLISWIGSTLVQACFPNTQSESLIYIDHEYLQIIYI
ncbi:hypothetical protein DEU56DRAFT_353916 [Suillus clintonianus]|uniref:uncharacterized protein n=1 Tax=Suillus clintonianus TaxID=1904413 RepID=UPI001B85BE53|nr:uncharacterized protein DEU56DRAFT_353916 [Suillus clintonianus]KAG2137037.1 hypothetical protein DEU56DRAFT_353916 [Suillus clintonianus]